MADDAQGQDDLQAQQRAKAACKRLTQYATVLPRQADAGAIQQQHHAMQHLARTHRNCLICGRLHGVRQLLAGAVPDHHFEKQRADEGNRRQQVGDQ
ncbi:hypothetical protein D3C85_1464270 [compost metagenome]